MKYRLLSLFSQPRRQNQRITQSLIVCLYTPSQKSFLGFHSPNVTQEPMLFIGNSCSVLKKEKNKEVF